MVTLTNVVPAQAYIHYSYTYEKLRGRAHGLMLQRREIVSNIYPHLRYWKRILSAYEALQAQQKFESTIRRKRNLMEFRKRIPANPRIPDLTVVTLRGPVAARYVAYWRKQLEAANERELAAGDYFDQLTSKQRLYTLY